MKPVYTLIVALALSACGKKTPPPPTVPPPATESAADVAAKAEDAAAAPADAAAKAEDAAAPAADVAGGAADKPDGAGDAAAAATDAAGDAAKVGGQTIPITTKSPEALAAFVEGRDLALNLRAAEAVLRFEKALGIDAGFVQAEAYRGQETPGPKGLALLENAASHVAALPEAERLHVEAMLAARKGDEKKATELTKKVAELASGDWIAHFVVGSRAYIENDLAGAAASLTKATELNPNVGIVHNMLGYANLQQGKKDEAIASFKRYAELAPNEPNPHDSLGDALLQAGKLAEAEAAYLKAAETVDFVVAWQGVASARAQQGNFKGAREALDKGLATATRPYDKLDMRHQLAWLLVVEGDVAGGLAALTKLSEDAAAEGDGSHATYALFDKAFLLLEAGTLDEAQAATNAAWELAEKLQTGGSKDASKRQALGLQAVIAARAGHKEDAAKHLAALDEVMANVTSAFGLSMRTLVQGQVLLVTDAKAAADKLATCHPDDYVCTWYEAMAHEKAGNAEAAAKAHKDLIDTPRRQLDYIWVVAHFAKK